MTKIIEKFEKNWYFSEFFFSSPLEPQDSQKRFFEFKISSIWNLKFVKNQSETFENDQKLTIILQIFSADAAKLWRRSGKNGRRVLTLQRQLILV